MATMLGWTKGASPARWNGEAAIRIVTAAAAALLALAAGYYAAHGPAWLGAPAEQWLYLLPIGLGAAAIGFWAVFRRPEVGLLLLVALLYTNASEVGVRHYDLPSALQLLSLAAFAGLITRLLPYEGRARQRLVLDPLLVPLSIYGLVMLASSLRAANLGVADEKLDAFLKGLLVFVVVTNLAASELTLRRVVWALVLSGAFLATISIYQVLTGSYDTDFGGFGRTKVAQIVGESREPRIAGSLSDPNFYAQILVALVPLALYRLWDERLLRAKLLAGYALAAITLAAVFTYSRGGALALGTILLFAVLHKRVSVKYFLVGALVLAPLMLLVPQEFEGRLGTLTQLAPSGNESTVTQAEDSSFRNRKILMVAAEEMFADHPVLGVGIGNYGDNFGEYGKRLGMTQRSFENFGERQFPHELYLEVAAETGIVGLLAFAAIIAATMIALWTAYRRFKGAGALRSANMVMSIALAISGFLLTSLFLHGTYLRYLWLLVAIAAAARQVSRRALPGQHDE